MPIEAKIAPQTQSIASAPAQAVGDSVALPPGSSVALNVQPSAIAGYSREGGDLLVHLKTGEVLRVTGFYLDPGKLSHLLLVQEDQLVAADLSQVGEAGIASAGYAPMNAMAGFSAPATAEAAGGIAAGAGAGAGAIGAGTLIPLAALGSSGLLAATVAGGGGGGGGGDSDEPVTPPDTTAPVAATNLVVSGAGDLLSGRAEAGATVRVDTDGDGTSDQTVTVAADGTFSAALVPALVNGETITVTVRDAAGNVGPAASVSAPDLTAPLAPQVTIAADGSGVTGTGEPGATVSVDIDADGDFDYTAVIAADGTFAIVFAAPLLDGEPITVLVTDAAGNSSAAVTVVAPDLVPPPATAPSIFPTNGSIVAGTAQSGVGIVITDAAGNVIAQVGVATDGSWSFTPPTPLPDGTSVSVAAINSEGQPGPAATVTVDALAPEPPTVSPSNGAVIAGTAEDGALVLLTDGAGNVIGQATASASGDWSFTFASPLPDGTVVVAVAQDASGNTSGQSSVTVDAIAPTTPTIAPPNATTISGTAEAGSTVLLTDGAGSPIGQTGADENGTWTFSTASPLADGSIVVVTAHDAAGNLSVPAFATVDALAPAVPDISPSSGTVLSGSAEPGSLVILTDGEGGAIGQVTAGTNGSWVLVLPAALPDGSVVSVIARDAAGNESLAAHMTVDGSAPESPSIQPSAGVVVTGSAEPGAVILLTDENGAAIGQAVASPGGAWSVTLANPLADGAIVTATAQDAAGNVSPPVSQAIDAAAPAAPTLALSNGTVISGTVEPGITVELTGASGSLIGRTVADASGNWSVTPASPLPDGFVINAVAQDAAGNTSGSATTTVDAVAPASPAIDPTNGAVITGTSENGALVTLSDAAGNVIGQVTADGAGNWSFSPSAPLPDGTVITAAASDATGNVGTPSTATVDALAPGTPVIAPSNGSEVTGTAEAGVTVTLVDGSGLVIGQTIVDGTGNWMFTPASPLPDGTVINASAQDAAGNTSGQASTTVDGTAPAAPVIDPTNGSEVTGSAEAGTILSLTDGEGNALGQVIVDGLGAWSFTPTSALPDGTVVNATAQDTAGNVSETASSTVDSTAPVDPTINPSNGSQVTGTAEPNSTVVLMDGTGNAFAAFNPFQAAARGGISAFAATGNVPALGLPIGDVVADADGNWILIPLLPLPDGTVVIAVSVDAAGNISDSVSTIVDGVAPTIPTIDPTAGLFVEGTGDPDTNIRLTDLFGNLIGEVTADGDGNWSFTPDTPLPDGTVIEALAVDAAGNESLAAIAVVDALEPLVPIVAASNGFFVSGTAEPGALVILSDTLGTPIGEVIADENGDWNFAPLVRLADGTELVVVAQDAAGNISPDAAVVVDGVAPASPVLSLLSGGELLSGTAEPGSQVRIIIDGLDANPIFIMADGNGDFSVPLLLPLVGGETVSATATDAAGNESQPATIVAPDIAPPAIEVLEADDGWINGAEASDGIQVEVALRPTMQVGQTITATLNGQGGYQAQTSHVIGAADLLAGFIGLSILPIDSAAGFPQGAATITGGVGGDASTPVNFMIDTIDPPAPVLSLAASLLTISSEPNSEVTVTADVNGIVASTVVTTNNSGLASLNLLTGLNLGLDWTQLLDAQVSAVGRDPAGNESNIASLSVAPLIEQPVTIHDLGIAVSLNPLNPQFGVTGTTDPGSSVAIRVVTPALNVQLLPISADSSGHFTLNLLNPAVLTQLGLNVTDILNLGSEISLGLVATDPAGHTSASYGLSLSPAGLSLNIGQIDVNGTTGDDIMSGSSSAEHINGNSGNDLIYNVSAGDHVLSGPGNDTIEITATNFSTVDSGTGFDTLLLANGIDLDYGPGVGTLANIERIDLGTGDSGSALTLTAAEVSAITDAGHTLQITGEANDVLHIAGATASGAVQSINSYVYDVYSFGAATVLVEENTIQVVV